MALNECKTLCLQYIDKFEDHGFWTKIAKEAKKESKKQRQNVLEGIEELKEDQNYEDENMLHLTATPSKMSLMSMD